MMGLHNPPYDTTTLLSTIKFDSRHGHPVLDLGWGHEVGVDNGDIIGQHHNLQPVYHLWVELQL